MVEYWNDGKMENASQSYLIRIPIFHYSREEFKMQKLFIFILITCISISMTSTGKAQVNKKLTSQIQKYRQANEHQIISEYFEFLSIPNVSRDTANVRKNAEFIKQMMKKRGIESQIIETNGNPVVFGELKVEGANQTLMFYAHYDGQPVDPSKWTETKPFEPALRPDKLEASANIPKPIPYPSFETHFNEDWRIYARSASDDKAPIMAMLAAIDALNNNNISLKSNLKFIFEGEEEAGSRNLRSFCQENKELLKSAVLFICDGPVYYSNDPTLFFGVRGITSMEITVYGPNTSLHSGHFGNWAPNPAMRLAKLLASMKAENGRVIIKGFYDSVVPLSDREVKALKAIPPYDSHLKKLYGFSREESNDKNLMEAIQLPSLNIRGLESGWVGSQARTIIPSTAVASIDIRLVKGNEPKEMVQKIIDHIKIQGFHVINKKPDQQTLMKYPWIAKVTGRNGYKAARTSMDLPISKRVIGSLTNYYGKEPVLMPTLGGSVPIYIFSDVLNVPTIGVPIVNHDNNQHQPDENLRIGHLWKGIETFAALILMED
jgi:acetylornithine deacetylase/succinyl-diaminopimelate desuccinylase-like protein